MFSQVAQLLFSMAGGVGAWCVVAGELGGTYFDIHKWLTDFRAATDNVLSSKQVRLIPVKVYESWQALCPLPATGEQGRR